MLTTDEAASAFTVTSDRRGDLRLRALLHPTERSRFALALVAVVLVVVVAVVVAALLDELWTLAGLTLTLALFGVSVWFSVQLFQAQLLGRAARVSGDNLPEVQAVLDQVREQLDFHRPVDVYVMDEVESHALLMKFLRTRVILLGGEFVADTLSEERRAELTFLVARFVGALKAKHLRLQPIRLAIAALEKLYLLNLILYPYDRATVYSGDQIGLACCGDLRAALRVLGRLMVGSKLAPKLGLHGVLRQAVSVRRRWLPRWCQLLLTHPHLTNRYLNLLAFARRLDPFGFEAFELELDEQTRRDLPAALRRAPGASRGHGQRRRAARQAWGLAAVLALVGVALVAVVRLGPSAPAAVVPASDPPATTVERPAPAPARVELAASAVASASSTARSSVDAGGNRVSYGAGNAIDGRRSTAWRTPGDGTGETLTLTWNHPVRVASVGLIPGYDKQDPYDGADRFLQNRRVTAARVTFSDGSAWDLTIADSRRLQRFPIAVVTDSVTIEVLATVPGQPGFDDTVISEVSVLGSDA
jgi:hypothetical protein